MQVVYNVSTQTPPAALVDRGFGFAKLKKKVEGFAEASNMTDLGKFFTAINLIIAYVSLARILRASAFFTFRY